MQQAAICSALCAGLALVAGLGVMVIANVWDIIQERREAQSAERVCHMCHRSTTADSNYCSACEMAENRQLCKCPACGSLAVTVDAVCCSWDRDLGAWVAEDIGDDFHCQDCDENFSEPVWEVQS